MRFQYLKNLFNKRNNTIATQAIVEKIPDSEIYDLIDAAVDEVTFEPEVLSAKSENDDNLTKVVVLDPEPPISVNEIPITFIIKKEMNGSRFEQDKANGISRITWYGKVDMETARTLLTYGADSVEFHGYKKLILDRSNLTEFETEARVWIKGLLKSRAKTIVQMVEKVAMINAKTTKGLIFSNFIASAISMVFPDLTMKKFENEAESIAWIMS